MNLTKRERAIIDRSYARNVDLKDWEERKLYAYAVSRLMRIERKLQRLYADSCNGYPKPVIEYREGKMYSYNVEDEARRERSEKAEARLEKEAKKICEKWGIDLHINGDPRGYALKINLNPEAWRSSSDNVDFIGMDTDLFGENF